MASFPVPSQVSTTHKLVEHQIPHEGLENLPPASRDLRPCTFGPLAVASFTGTRNEWAGVFKIAFRCALAHVPCLLETTSTRLVWHVLEFDGAALGYSAISKCVHHLKVAPSRSALK